MSRTFRIPWRKLLSLATTWEPRASYSVSQKSYVLLLLAALRKRGNKPVRANLGDKNLTGMTDYYAFNERLNNIGFPFRIRIGEGERWIGLAPGLTEADLVKRARKKGLSRAQKRRRGWLHAQLMGITND